MATPAKPIDRKEAMARTFAAAFGALDDLRAKDPEAAREIGVTVQAHLRSSMPQVTLLDTGPMRTVELIDVELADARVEIEKLRQEIEAMRPVYVAALRKRESEHEFHADTKDCHACAQEAAGPCSAHLDVFEVMITRDGELDETIDASTPQEVEAP